MLSKVAEGLHGAEQSEGSAPIPVSAPGGSLLIPARPRPASTYYQWPRTTTGAGLPLESTNRPLERPLARTELALQRVSERALPRVLPVGILEAIHTSLATAHFLQVDAKGFQLAAKRIIDVTVSATALIVLLPLFAAVAALIKLGSPGPVFFSRERLGRGGQRFRMLKFRSMVIDAEQLRTKLATNNESAGPVFKMKDDPRLTRLGRFLRKYSIDELPQLVNVLRGDMSLVGPRPPLASEVAEYDFWQLRRLSVRPGLTCIWQASPRRYRIPFEEWMKLDLQYIDNWSLGIDLGLILRTIPVVLKGTGQ